jgi:hypothetical protein
MTAGCGNSRLTYEGGLCAQFLFPFWNMSSAFAASSLLIETCAQLVGPDARTPALVAIREGVTAKAIYERRRRFEKRTGHSLPRLHRVGRPKKT